MADREKVIKSLKWFRDRDKWREGIMIHDDHAEVRKQICNNAIELLKEQETEKDRILKIVWDVLHRGYSIDTEADQDWVYERIRNQIEGTYEET